MVNSVVSRLSLIKNQNNYDMNCLLCCFKKEIIHWLKRIVRSSNKMETDKIEKSNMECLKERIVVIGNGFDLSLGIKSSYADFLNYVTNQKELKSSEDIYNFNRIFVQEFNGTLLNWCDFETMFENHMREINEESNRNEFKQTKKFHVNQLNKDLRALEKSFFDYLKREYERWESKSNTKKMRINSFYKRLLESEKTKVISFNFTNSIEKIQELIGAENKHLGVPTKKTNKIFQLHGSLDKNNIIFGGGFTGSEFASKMSVESSVENDKLVRVKKDPTLFSDREKLLEELDATAENKLDLFILGHSIAGSDFVFLKPFFEKAEKIYLFYYDQDYSYKLQFIIQTLGKEYAEKIYLVPFFDVFMEVNEKNRVLKSLEDYEVIKNMFNFPMPQNDYFGEFDMLANNFVFRQIKQIKIERTVDVEKILEIFGKLNVEKLNIEEDFSITLHGIKDEELFDRLLDNKVFQKALKEVAVIEIKECNLNLDKLVSLLDDKTSIMSIQHLTLTKNIISYENDSLDISIFEELDNLELIGNEFISLQEKNLGLVISSMRKNKLLNLEVRENTKLIVAESLCNNSPIAKEMILTITMNDSNLTIPKVEWLELVGYGGDQDEESFSDLPELPELAISESVKGIRLSDFKIDSLKLSTLFESNNQMPKLPNLEYIELENISISWDQLTVDVLCNVFIENTDPYISLNGDQRSFSDLLCNGKQESNLQEENQSAILLETEADVTEPIADIQEIEAESPIVSDSIGGYQSDKQPFLTIDEKPAIEKILNDFAEKWCLDPNSLKFAVNNYRTGTQQQIGEADLKKSANYDAYKASTSNPVSKLKYWSVIKKEYKKLIYQIDSELSI